MQPGEVWWARFEQARPVVLLSHVDPEDETPFAQCNS